MRVALGVDGAHPVFVLLDALDVRGGDELDRARVLHRVEERLVNVGPVANRVRIAEPLAERLAHGNRGHLGAVDRVHHHESIRVDRLRARAFAHAERIEGRERIGPELDAGADLADLGRLLEDPHRVAAARDGERRGEAADSAAGDEEAIVPGRGSHRLTCHR